jgi:hypothetical protein
MGTSLQIYDMFFIKKVFQGKGLVKVRVDLKFKNHIQTKKGRRETIRPPKSKSKR